MSVKILIGRALAAACAAALAGCPNPEAGRPPKAKDIIEIYAKDPADGSKEFRIASLIVGTDGNLSVALEKDVPAATEALKNAVAAIQARKALKFMEEHPRKISGRNVTAYKEIAVTPGDDLYLDAVAHALMAEFGIDARFP